MNPLKTYVARRFLSVHPSIETRASPRFCKVAHSPFSEEALTRILVNRTSGPVGPVGPVGPDSPVGPVGPVKPVGPVGPVNPVGPLTPVGPVDPVAAREAARHKAKEPTRTPANHFDLAPLREPTDDFGRRPAPFLNTRSSLRARMSPSGPLSRLAFIPCAIAQGSASGLVLKHRSSDERIRVTSRLASNLPMASRRVEQDPSSLARCRQHRRPTDPSTDPRRGCRAGDRSA